MHSTRWEKGQTAPKGDEFSSHNSLVGAIISNVCGVQLKVNNFQLQKDLSTGSNVTK